MPEKYTADHTYSDQELVDLYRQLIARGAVAGEEVMHGGKRVRFPGMKQALEIVERLEAKIAAAANGAGATNYARFRRP